MKMQKISQAHKEGDMTPYPMAKKPSKQYPFLLPLIWGGAYLMTRAFHLKIKKVNMKGLKPPYLVIATHQGFSDYYIGPLAMFPRRAMYVSDMEGFANFGDWLYRGLGCIPKRRYVSDISVVKNMKYALSKKQSVVVYPESRHSNVGTTAYIPKNLGKLVKVMDVPLVLLTAKGSYLANPFWDEEHTRKVPMEATLTGVYTKEQVENTSEAEIQKTIEEYLSYDEYRYQKEKGIKIKDKKRAEGLHKPLYQCFSCGEKYGMESREDKLFCTKCKKSWTLLEDGSLNGEVAIPDWYEWQRKQAVSDIPEEYKELKNYSVEVKALPNHKGFVDLGAGNLRLNTKEFVLSFGDTFMHFPHKERESVQTEYNYAGSGMCIVLSTKDCCYYIYSKDADFNPTELQFMGEYLYQRKQEKIEGDRL